MTDSIAWPSALAGTPAAAVIESALSRQRLGHSLLLHGDDHEMLVAVAYAIAERLLNSGKVAAKFSPAQHPDCFELRPSGKMRQISAEAVRNLIGKVQMSSAVAPRKVAILHETDRLHLTAANIFLKTLEEPPANTTLLLLTTRPYALLPTIRSRVLHFRFPANLSAEALVKVDAACAQKWSAWLDDYRAWLARLDKGVADKRAASDAILALYGLVARFGKILDQAAAAAWTKEKENLPADLDDDERAAIETGLANGIRARLLAEIESATRTFSLPRLTKSADAAQNARRSLTSAIDSLERSGRLLRLNLNESAALEEFLLTSLRLWAKR